MVTRALVPGRGERPCLRTVLSMSIGACALGAGMLLGLTDVHAKSAPAHQAELLPPETVWVDTQLLECTRAQLRDLQEPTLATRARVAQACAALLMDTETFVVRQASLSVEKIVKKTKKAKAHRHKTRAARVKTGFLTEVPWDVEEEQPTEVSADEMRYIMGRYAVDALHGYLSARVDGEPACSKVIVRYGLDNACRAEVKVTVLEAANSDVAKDITRLMKRALGSAREGMDCHTVSARLDGEVSLIPVQSGPTVSLQARL